MAENQAETDRILERFLGKDVYVVIARPVRSPEITQRIEEHLAQQVKLEKDGIMFAAGPMTDEGEDTPSAGMFMIRAKSWEEARAIADQDPLHKAGLRRYTLHRWRINEGGFTLKVSFSDQAMTLD